MTDEERLSRLVDELASKPSYATGGRPFPRAVSADDAVAIAAALAESVDEGTAVRARIAVAEGFAIACQAGCNACCEVPVMVYAPEAVAAARWLARPENAAARAAFLDGYTRWRAAVGDAPERIADHSMRGEQAAYDALTVETWRKRALCAFNHDGKCVIYPVRPIGCRNAHAVGTSDRCRPDHPAGTAEALAFVPLDQLVQNATRLLRATHNATHPQRHRLESICAAVYRLLDGK